MTTTTIKALRDALQVSRIYIDSIAPTPICKQVKAALALTADASEDAPDDADDYAMMQMGKLLAEIAIIMKGKEKPLHRHSYHDLPELVSIMACELEIYHATYGTTIPAPDASRPALVGAVQAVDGWQWVPKVPTPAMLNAMFVLPDFVGRLIVKHSVDKLPDAYSAMLAAAPAAPIAAHAKPEAGDGAADARCGYIARKHVMGSSYGGITSLDVIVHNDDYAVGGALYAIDCMIERENGNSIAASKVGE